MSDDLNTITREGLNIWRHPAANDAKYNQRQSPANEGPDISHKIAYSVGVRGVLIGANKHHAGPRGEGPSESQVSRIPHKGYDMNNRVGHLTSHNVSFIIG